jgi:hypothetical protein
VSGIQKQAALQMLRTGAVAVEAGLYQHGTNSFLKKFASIVAQASKT